MQQPWDVSQVVQLAPLTPQLSLVFPCWQTWLASQQPGQLCGVQIHWPVESSHFWPPWQPGPQLPPQPSGPHCLPWQFGTQTHWPFWQGPHPGQFTHARAARAAGLLRVPRLAVPVLVTTPGGTGRGGAGALPWHWPLAVQVWPGKQLPQVPVLPQPSGPHSRPAQFGAQHNPGWPPVMLH